MQSVDVGGSGEDEWKGTARGWEGAPGSVASWQEGFWGKAAEKWALIT